MQNRQKSMILNGGVTAAIERASNIDRDEAIHAMTSSVAVAEENLIVTNEQRMELYADLIKQLEEEAKAAENELKAKEEEQKRLFQEKMKELQSLKAVADKKLAEEEALLKNVNDQLAEMDDKFASLKDEATSVIKKENSYVGRREATFQFFLDNFKTYFSHSSAENQLEGCINGKKITTFSFDKEVDTKKDIADQMWKLLESS